MILIYRHHPWKSQSLQKFVEYQKATPSKKELRLFDVYKPGLFFLLFLRNAF